MSARLRLPFDSKELVQLRLGHLIFISPRWCRVLYTELPNFGWRKSEVSIPTGLHLRTAFETGLGPAQLLFH